jgi:hypothetical protein
MQMRHERIATEPGLDRAEVAAVWPILSQVAPLPIIEIEQPAQPDIHRSTPAAPDVPAAVGKLIAGAYAALIAALFIAAAGSRESVFVITISALFVVMFFTVPRLMFRAEADNSVRPSLERFLSEGMDTLTGHSSGAGALVQILVVPALLTIGVLIIAAVAAYQM